MPCEPKLKEQYGNAQSGARRRSALPRPPCMPVVVMGLALMARGSGPGRGPNFDHTGSSELYRMSIRGTDMAFTRMSAIIAAWSAGAQKYFIEGAAGFDVAALADGAYTLQRSGRTFTAGNWSNSPPIIRGSGWLEHLYKQSADPDWDRGKSDDTGKWLIEKGSLQLQSKSLVNGLSWDHTSWVGRIEDTEKWPEGRASSRCRTRPVS